jgi:EAL domain-containing protein (putative c-di-GMP-specific phosphodiesterase class I)
MKYLNKLLYVIIKIDKEFILKYSLYVNEKYIDVDNKEFIIFAYRVYENCFEIYENEMYKNQKNINKIIKKTINQRVNFVKIT